ncbi:hypothetical protein S40285_04328 [Stachybotrys chlorohalonatus IBT 40285]|uniref:SET domain-containing protein n=1 Tax=Stachybotrys chlorohalonatus (strain IBT 40285) TaxID=1283841 RepID=A0A084QNP6_STAC4|nr:hypothetical protein S40285_04328 [Stachybotrys chlorohalonata IBT 40285]
MLNIQFPAAVKRLFYLDLCFHHKDPQSSTKHKDYTLPTIPHRRSLEALDLEGYGAIKIDSPFVAGSDDQPSALPLPAAARVTKSESAAKLPSLWIVQRRSPKPNYSNEFFRISESKTAGYGAYAKKDLYGGDVILREAYLLKSIHSDFFDTYERLDEGSKTILQALHMHDGLKIGTSRIQGIWETNCFAINDHQAALFPIAARFNHACSPTQKVLYEFDEKNDCIVMTVRADHVAAGEELTISYGNDWSPLMLYHLYGFMCRCGACPGLSEAEVMSSSAQW